MSSVALRPDVTGTAERVLAGELFTGLLLDDAEQRAFALETLLGTVVEDDTRVVWVGNPLRSALTIERFLIQIAGPEIDLREERTPKEIAGIIAKQVGSETRLLVVVQQPETISAETIQLLVQTGWYLGGEAIQVQFLFAGSSAFVVPRIAASSSGLDAARPADRRQSPPVRQGALPLLMLLLAVAVGVMVSAPPPSHDGMPHRAPSSLDVALLRREFDVFLAQRTPPLPHMSGRDKETLFTRMITNDSLHGPQPE